MYLVADHPLRVPHYWVAARLTIKQEVFYNQGEGGTSRIVQCESQTAFYVYKQYQVLFIQHYARNAVLNT